jgi:putative tryptophan/tyrosine transport system substrate-binding protein
MRMRRREVITLLGGAAAALPLGARAQQPAMPVIGFLSSVSRDPNSLAVFRQGLKEVGFIEGQNVKIEYKWADGEYDRLPALAADLVRRQVAVIATTGGSPPVRAAKAASATIPIVFTGNFDPVELGFVASLNRPGGNLTGVTGLGAELGPKRLALLHELVPTATTFAILANPTNAGSEAVLRRLHTAAGTLGVQLEILQASTQSDFDTAFAALIRLRAGGLVVAADPLFNVHGGELAAQALRNAVPTIYQYREFAAAGGLMSYGNGNGTDNFRVLGAYTGRILKGEKSGDLPVQQATKVELFINLKTAKALGLTVPLALLTRADEVIE